MAWVEYILSNGVPGLVQKLVFESREKLSLRDMSDGFWRGEGKSATCHALTTYMIISARK
jgi:hypothetical protein